MLTQIMTRLERIEGRLDEKHYLQASTNVNSETTNERFSEVIQQ